MYLYSHLATEPCYVWNTGEEEEVLKYMSLLDSTLHVEENTFNYYEQKLLLLALTYRLCSVYNRKLITERASVGRKHDIFIRLIQLIEQHYKEQRGVEFYADKLCLSPKYLSVLSKSICGYTVQELVFKAIIRKVFRCSRIRNRPCRKYPTTSTSRMPLISALSSGNKQECLRSNSVTPLLCSDSEWGMSPGVLYIFPEERLIREVEFFRNLFDRLVRMF